MQTYGGNSGGLRVALLVDGRVPVGRYGGTERVVVWLARELVRLGHAVTVVARAGSYVPGARMIFADTRRQTFERIPSDIDIVHSHCGAPPAGIARPCLTTSHGNGLAPVGGNWSFVSRDHARRHGRETFVHNGLPVEDHYFSEHKSDRYLFFGGMTRAGKNVAKALGLAIANDLTLDLAGGTRWSLLARSQVRREGAFFSSLDRRFRFHGKVGGWEKARLFADARALLFPIRWEEPFGLVVVEALLAGTPVIASPRGAMPELLDPDVGFLCRDDSEFAEAFRNVGALSPRRCREYAAEHFSVARTTPRYIELYRRILDGETLP